MNKSFHNAIPTILFVALAVFLGRAQGCGLFHNNAFENRCANMVELCPAYLQLVDSNYTGLHSYGTNGYSRDSVDEDAVPGGRMADEDQGQELDTKIYEVRPSAGKGFGVFATKLITRGTQIIVEEPLISVAMPEMVAGQGFKIMDMLSDLETEFQALSPEQQADFLQLHDFRFASEDKQSHLLTIFRSNAFNTGDKHVGLFPKIARINHSCRPNSGSWWSEKQGHRVIYAALDIQEGEEITVSYIPLLKKSSERQQRLGQYGFTCDCPACQSEPGESDKRRVKIARLLETLEQSVYHPSKKAATNEKSIDKALSLIEMIEEEGLADYLHRAFKLAALFNKIGGRFEDAEMWARKALEILQWAEQGSTEVREVLDFMESLAPGNLRENSIL